MAVGPDIWPEMHIIDGVRIGVAQGGIKRAGRDDVTLFEICEGARVAGVFTQNAFCAEPVKIAKQHLAKQNVRYFLINSGNANACTGKLGNAAAMKTCNALAGLTQVDASSVIPFSTGVIGELLPADKIINVLPQAIESLDADNWTRAGRSIMTTDTRPKGASCEVNLGDKVVKITGISKGAGMINPNMATMLAYIATDADVDQALLNKLAKRAANLSFNRITIDGDTSTNDACMVIATGKAGNATLVDEASPEAETFAFALIDVYQQLAQQIVRDGEGATKFISVHVRGGATHQECVDVAYAIAHSPLIKTAMFASDPNWGRIICAIGYAGVPNLDVDGVKVWLDETLIVEDGGRAASYTEEQGQAVVSKAEFAINVDLGRGDFEDVIWTSDLSHEYIRINAEYRS
ncbi:bifunctional glutamate N-acetyltransferase/amino-acid acetyltransferase ArgJ [Saccharophagus degradans]|uniref:Arginine biosynthesis bifunctional protein ArgJ n=1 Tax=Saccharophagus degradans TaxID=86304 RepID=A0AAW7XA12_9GAMM|nr:bifunctional glutamate N-acetyltransferase/amino-acid acetyltransferase ArgJ [Saccharophagus degradans]MDO6423214.1 bifunctional glutamate N-acetyltransferase/amino-acid acetyltransferase ArgJ [Saccharophagus degradans]MDO6607262.1 bifunctional glutamate N-acetyltransferase/amino-acid acetyltransferase ArgJ [Saccharophagus degradans]